LGARLKLTKHSLGSCPGSVTTRPDGITKQASLPSSGWY